MCSIRTSLKLSHIFNIILLLVKSIWSRILLRWVTWVVLHWEVEYIMSPTGTIWAPLVSIVSEIPCSCKFPCAHHSPLQSFTQRVGGSTINQPHISSQCRRMDDDMWIGNIRWSANPWWLAICNYNNHATCILPHVNAPSSPIQCLPYIH